MEIDNTYNGWTNYATWLINLEIFQDFEIHTPVTGSMLEDMAHEIIFPEGTKGLCASYALAFIERVNWDEIAEAINEDNGHNV